MKVIIDNKIPYIEGVLEPFAEVIYLPGNVTTRDVVKDADALVTRTRTICSREILEGSKVKFIATATIGFDHIDTEYCKAAGIEWTNAPGCNAESVNQYIASALCSYAKRKRFALKGKTIGIVGVGQVGSRVAKTCEILGMKVLLNDPPRERKEGSSQFVTLKTIQEQADIITFHVPLNVDGIDRTWHMVDAEFLKGLGKKAMIVNTCRGGVFQSKAVCDAKLSGALAGLVIDCWENEPELDPDLLKLADYGTSHIAGYSKDGKAKGTKMSVRAISRFFGLGIDAWEPAGVEPPSNPVIELDGSRQKDDLLLADAILSTYEIEKDDKALRDNPQLFEQLRGDYPVRREFGSYSVSAKNVGPQLMERLRKLGVRRPRRLTAASKGSTSCRTASPRSPRRSPAPICRPRAMRFRPAPPARSCRNTSIRATTSSRPARCSACSSASCPAPTSLTRYRAARRAGPQRSPLGLSADPGGLPLYKAGTPVGGVGVISDAAYSFDADISDSDTDDDELIALAASFGFAAPGDRRADRIAVDGRVLRFTDGRDVTAQFADPGAAPVFASINNVAGALVAVPGYVAAASAPALPSATRHRAFAPMRSTTRASMRSCSSTPPTSNAIRPMAGHRRRQWR